MTLALLGAVVAGALTTLAPCVLPLLPVIVGGSVARGAEANRGSTASARKLDAVASTSSSGSGNLGLAAEDGSIEVWRKQGRECNLHLSVEVEREAATENITVATNCFVQNSVVSHAHQPRRAACIFIEQW